MRLAQQIEVYLKAKGWTAAELSRRSRVSKSVLSKWEAGARPRDLDQVKRVADTLGTSLDWLCFGDGIEPIRRPGTDLSELLGDDWVGGVFELKIRRIRPKA